MHYGLDKLFLLILFLLGVCACDPCDDCNAVSAEPTINLVFINADSLSKLNDSLIVNKTRREVLEVSIAEFNDTLDFLVDSLQVITDSIENGGDMQAEHLSVESAISDAEDEKLTKTDQVKVLDSLSVIMNHVKTVINSGLLLVNQIEILETGSVLIFTDSAISYQLPLSFNKSFRNYSVTTGSEVNTLEVDYELFQEVDVSRNVLVRAQDIMIINHSFDSLNSCQENCFDGESTYTFYF